MATDLAKLVVRLEAENSKLTTALDKSTRELNQFRRSAETAVDGVSKAFKNLAAIGLSVGSFAAVARSVKDVINQADDLGKFAQKVGITVEELSALNYAAELSGVSTDELGNGLKRLAANALDTANGVGEAKEAFSALGIDVRNASGDIKGANDLLLEIATKFAQAEDGVTKTAIAMRIFGKSGAELIPFLNEGASGLEQLRVEAERLGIVISTDTAQSAEEFNDNLTRLQKSSQSLSIELATKMLPALTDISNAMAEAAKESGVLQSLLVGLGGVMSAIAVPSDRTANAIRNLNEEIKNTEVRIQSLESIARPGDVNSGVNNELVRLRKELADLRALRDELSRKPVQVLVSDKAVAQAETAKTQIKGITVETQKLSAVQKTALREQEEFSKRLQSLVASLDPVSDKTEKYMQAVSDLDRAWIEGRISGERYDQLLIALATDSDAAAKAAEDAAQAEREAARVREDAAQRAQDLALEPFRNALNGVQEAFTDALENIFNGNVNTFNDLARTVRGIMVRLAAEIGALMVFRPQVVGGVATALGLGSSGTALASPTSAGVGFSPLSAVSNLLGPAGSLLGIGALGGGLIGSLTGGNRLGASLGGAAGAYGGLLLGSGALGGVTGAAVGAIGQLGNFVVPGLGLVAGALLGGLFGNNRPSDRAQAGGVNLATGQLLNLRGQTGKKFSQENADLRTQVLQQASEIAQALQQVTGGTLDRQLNVVIGSRDGLRFGFEGDPQQNVGNSVDALMSGIIQSMLGALQGVDDELRGVFGRLDFSDLSGALTDIESAARILATDFSGEQLSAAAQAIQNINSGFDALIEDAARLGLATDRIEAARQRELTGLVDDFNYGISQIILGFTDPLQAALNVFEEQAAERLQTARDLGVDLVDVERANALERQQIIEQFNQQSNQALVSANQSIERFLSGLRSGPQSFLSPTARLENAEREFEALVSAARNDDVTARANLPSVAANLVSANRAVLGSSELFFERVGFIDRTLSNLIGSGSTSTFDNLGSTIATGDAAIEYQLKALNDKVTELTTIMSDQAAVIARLSAA